MADIIIVAIILAAVCLAIKKLRKDKKEGKGCAGCSASCSHSDENKGDKV